MVETLARPQAPWALRLLPPFPSIAHRVMTLASREDVNLQELAEVGPLDETVG